MPTLARARQRAAEVKCLSYTSELGRSVLVYAVDFRDSFPATRSDRAEDLVTQRARLGYSNQVFRVFTSDAWRDYSALPRTSPVYRCPANTPDRQQGWNFPVDRWLSASLFVRPEYLDPRFNPQLMGQQLGARVQNVSGVVFPDAKVGLFETEVWHSYKGYAAPGMQASTLLDYRGSQSPGAVWFIDGHATQMFPRYALPAVHRGSYWGLTIYGTTEWGVRGRDLR